MTAILQFSTLPLVHVLGWTLVHFCWEGALVALLLACTLAILPSRASQLRYAVACAAMALMAASPLITLGVLAAQTQTAGEHFAVPALSDGHDSGLSISPDQPAEPWTMRCERSLNRLLPGVVGVWFLGVLILLFRLNLGLMVARRMKLSAVEPATAELQSVLRELKNRLGIERAVRLVNSAVVQAPAVVGWLRPVILVPAGCMMGLSAAQTEALLAHELAHIRRHDYLASLFQMVVEAVLFYHPAVWWVSRQMRREREHCCDDLAVSVSGDKLAYAKALSFLEERRSPAPAGSFAATGGVLKMRIARLLGVNQAPVFPRTAAIILLVLAGIVAGIVALGPARAQSAQQQSSPATESIINSRNSSPYVAWLNQEAVWIITPEEKQAFLRLSNDQERDAFIEQFWDRRNPNHGSPGNKFRDEHYRRITYADAHFAVAAQPGWETDRGHVYIVYGPPDSIDSHPSAANSTTRPFEVWHYQSIRIEEPAVRSQDGSGRTAQTAIRNNFDFRFADDCSCGQYQLQSPWPTTGTTTEPHASFLAQNQGSDIPPKVHISAGVAVGLLIQKTYPIYPPIAKAARVSGTVVLVATISKTGEVEDLHAVSGPAMLQQAAQEAVKTWRYRPYLLNNEPVEVETTVNVIFTLGAEEHGQGAAGAQAPPPPPLPPPPPAGDLQKVHISAGVAVGLLIQKTVPVYPPIAKAARVSGTVVLVATISKTGEVEDLHAVSGPAMLQQAAQEAVRTWRYKPYLLNNEPVEVETTVNVIFTLGAEEHGQGAAGAQAPPPPPPPPPPPGQAADISVQVRKLTIVSDDLPASEQSEIAQTYDGNTYPLEELKERVRQNLRNLGYAEARAEIQDQAALLAAPPTGPVDISVRVSAGAKYRLTEIRVEGNQAIKTDEIIKLFPIHLEDLFNATAIGKGLENLMKLYGSMGYTKIGAIPQTRMDEVHHTVSLTIHIDEGKPNRP